MRKFALTVLTAAVMAVPLVPATASTRLVSAPSCEEPAPTRRYDARGMTYGLAVDYAGCWWWDGSPIQLEATLSRLDGTGEEGSTTVVLCGGVESAERSDEPADDQAPEVESGGYGRPARSVRPEWSRARSATCDVSTGLEHPAVEFARYRGEITYPWRNGPRTVNFVAFCTSPGRVCREG